MSFNKRGLLKFSLLSLVLLALIVAWLGFGDRGFVHLYRMEEERRVHLERIEKLEKENQRLLEEIQRLRADREYIEDMARRELGLVKDNELLFRFSREAAPSGSQAGKKK